MLKIIKVLLLLFLLKYYIYQETLKNNIYPGILLATPTEHNRFEFYPKEERKES